MLIHLEKLGKTFGEKVVLHDVTASVEREDRIGIVGQNGAGKTTLLKILTGEYQDYEGEFSVTHGVTLGYLEQNAKLDATLDIYGEMRATFAPVLDAMAQMQILERRMAAQPDNADLLAQHDALQNIVDAADGYNMDVNIKKVLSGMGFAQDTWQKNIAVLSGGELTRLRLAKLLLEKPDVLILDEPTVGLDPKQVVEIRDLIRHLAKDHTVILSSHILSEVSAVCDHIMIIAHGKLVASDSPENLQKLMSGSMELDLEVKGSIAAVKSALQEISQIDRIEENTEASKNIAKLKVISKENADIREQVFYALADAKLPILEMTHAEKSLEDIFLELTEDVAPTQPEKHKLFSKRKRLEMSDVAAQQTEASEEEAQPEEEKKETVTTKEAESYASHL